MVSVTGHAKALTRERRLGPVNRTRGSSSPTSRMAVTERTTATTVGTICGQGVGCAVRRSIQLLFVAALASWSTAAAAPTARYASGIPVNAVLNAPFTPFTATGALNVDVVPALAKDAAASGCNVVWIAGSMGEFDSLTLDERKALAEAWVPAAKAQGLYTIVHVGTTVQADAITLAAHAASIGADSIASVPPYYTRAGDVNALAAWFVPIVQASGNLPFFFYHLPAVTYVTFSMASFIPAALAVLPTFAGVKFVSPDNGDYFTVQQQYGSTLSLMFAPEPKLQGVGLGAKGVILAESFYAPTWLRMCQAVAAKDTAAALTEQAWKQNVSNVFGSFPGQAERVVYAYKLGVDIGPPRPPLAALPQSQWAALHTALDQYGFWNQTTPPPCLLQ